MKSQLAFAIGIPLAMLVALVAWAFASPVGASPDDDYHMTSIWCGQGLREGLCEAGDADEERRVPAVLLESSCFAFNSEQSASCKISPSDELVNSNRGNFTGDYPPIYYGAMSVFAGSDVGTSILAMRIANAVVFVGLLSALAFVLPRRLRVAAVLPFTVASVPLGMFLVASVNPSSWAILSAAGLWVSVVGFVRAAQVWRVTTLGVFAILFTLVGSGARSDSAVYAGLAVVLALILTYQRGRRWLVGACLAALLAILAALSFLTSGQSSAVSAGDDVVRGGLTAILANLVHLPDLWVGSLGTWGLGWLDTALPPLVWVSSIVAFAAYVFTGLRRMSTRKGLGLALTLGALTIIPMYILYIGGVSVGAAVQPRYIYPLVIVLAGLAWWHRDAVLPWLSRTQWVVLAILLAVANSVALHTNLRRYVTGTDGNGADLDERPEWWWDLAFGPNWVWGAGSVAFAVAIALIVRWSAYSAALHPVGSRKTEGPA